MNRTDAERKERINYDQYRRLLDMDASGGMISAARIRKSRKTWKMSRSILAAYKLEVM